MLEEGVDVMLEEEAEADVVLLEEGAVVDLTFLGFNGQSLERIVKCVVAPHL